MRFSRSLFTVGLWLGFIGFASIVLLVLLVPLGILLAVWIFGEYRMWDDYPLWVRIMMVASTIAVGILSWYWYPLTGIVTIFIGGLTCFGSMGLSQGKAIQFH